VRQSLLRFLVLWLATLEFALCAGEAGLRLNTSASVRRGFYWISPQPAKRGGYVALCPPKAGIFELAMDRGYFGRGRCPSGYDELIKIFAAGPGDHVRIDSSGVRVGNRLWPNSAPMRADAAGRPLVAPVLDTTLTRGWVLVMSQDCASGFDGRYFGLLSRSDIVGTAVPLLTW
jgi:conjugative transfer signal peptidase TraF